MADSIYEVVGGGVTIGNAVSGGTANTILFSDASTNLADSTDLFWDDVLKIFHVGDFGLAANSTFMSLDDQNSLITNQTDGVFKVVNSSGDRLILVDVVNGDYGIGDIDGILNSTRFVIDDTTKAASIAAGGDRMRLDINGTAFTSKLGDTGAVGNSTILVVDDATANKKVTSTGIEISIVAGAINFTHAPSSDSMGRTTGFTGTATTTYTITVAGSGVDFDWTDGTNSGTNVPMDAPNQTLLSNGISVYFVEFGTYTPGDYYTFTFTVSNVGVQGLLLDYKNATYSIGDTTAARSKARLTVNDVGGGIQAITDGGFSVRNSANTNTIFSAGGSSVSFGISTGVGYTFTGTSSKSDNDWIIADSSVANIGIFSVRDGNYNNSGWLWIDPMSGDYYFGDQYNNRTRIYIDDDTSTFNVNSIGLVKIGDTSSANNNTLLTVDDSAKKIKQAADVSVSIETTAGVQRVITPMTPKSLTDNTLTSVFEISLPAGGMTGGFFTANVIADDGTDFQAHSDHVTYAAVNKAGSYTTTIQASNGDDAIAVSAGTLAISWSMTTGTDKVIVQVTANSSLTTPTIKLYLNIDNNNGHVLTLL